MSYRKGGNKGQGLNKGYSIMKKAAPRP